MRWRDVIWIWNETTWNWNETTVHTSSDNSTTACYLQ